MSKKEPLFWRREPIAAGALVLLALATITLGFVLAWQANRAKATDTAKDRALAEEVEHVSPDRYCRLWRPDASTVYGEPPVPLCEQAQPPASADCEFVREKRRRALDVLAMRVDARTGELYTALSELDLDRILRTTAGADFLYDRIRQLVLPDPIESLTGEMLVEAGAVPYDDNGKSLDRWRTRLLFLRRVAALLMAAQRNAVEVLPTKSDDAELATLLKSYDAEDFDPRTFQKAVRDAVAEYMKDHA